MKLNNRGMSIVEMVVAFAILAIVSVSIFSMLLTATKTYTRMQADTKMQLEAQLAIANVEQQVMQCSDGIAWNSSQKALFIVDEEDGSRYMHVVYLDSTKNELYYGNQDIAEGQESANIEFYLLAEHVTDLDVVLTQNAENDVTKAKLTVTLEKSDKTYKEQKTVALRSKPPLCNGSLAGGMATVTGSGS